MTDFRALCIELTDCLEKADWPLRYRYVFRQWVDIARAALADGPAVPDGREPASVVSEPSDEELLETLDKATATFPPRHPEAEGLNAVEYPLALELRKARAVLTRWGNPAPQPPAEGEVAELVAWLRDDVDLSPADKRRAADLLERLASPACVVLKPSPELIEAFQDALPGRIEPLLSQRHPTPVPVAEGEDADEARYLVTELRDQADDMSPSLELFGLIHRAADLLEQRHPAPVAVGERLPGAGDCDEKGSCWLWTADDVDGVGHWSYSHRDWAMEGDVTHWLPAHALPLPGQEVR